LKLKATAEQEDQREEKKTEISQMTTVEEQDPSSTKTHKGPRYRFKRPKEEVRRVEGEGRENERVREEE
jgi:hypothetical protein